MSRRSNAVQPAVPQLHLLRIALSGSYEIHLSQSRVRFPADLSEPVSAPLAALPPDDPRLFERLYAKPIKSCAERR